VRSTAPWVLFISVGRYGTHREKIPRYSEWYRDDTYCRLVTSVERPILWIFFSRLFLVFVITTALLLYVQDFSLRLFLSGLKIYVLRKSKGRYTLPVLTTLVDEQSTRSVITGAILNIHVDGRQFTHAREHEPSWRAVFKGSMNRRPRTWPVDTGAQNG